MSAIFLIVERTSALVVTPSLVFESEANDITSQPLRFLNSAESALGHLGVGDTDIFAIYVEAGDLLTVSTQTPFDGANSSLLNLLDPAITIIASDGTTLTSDLDSADDGKNSYLSFTAPTSGTYYVQVDATFGIGDYVVTTEIESPLLRPANVRLTNAPLGTAGQHPAYGSPVRNTNLLPAPLAFSNTRSAPEADPILLIDKFMIEFAQEDEEEEDDLFANYELEDWDFLRNKAKRAPRLVKDAANISIRV